MRVAAALRAAGALALLVAVAHAQDPVPPPGLQVPIEVRIDRTIVDPGTPLEGAWAAFVGPGEGPREAAPRAVATGPDGRCVVAGPAGGGVLLVWGDGRAPVALHTRGRLSSAVVLEPANALRVEVRRPSGEPAGDAAVTATVSLPVAGAPLGVSELQVYEVADRTGPDGVVELAELPDVNLHVRADVPGAVGPERFPVRPGGAPVVLQATRGARVSGRVSVIPGGGAAEGAVVRAGGAAARVGADGTYELAAVPPGPVELRVETPELLLRTPVRLVLEDGARRAGVDLELVRAAVLSGEVVAADGSPVAEADVALSWPPSTAPWSGLRRDVPSAVTAATNGRFRIAELPPAEGVALEVRAPGHAPALVEGLSLAPGVQTGPVRIELRAGARITGRVVDGAGAAVAEARVEARPVGDALDRQPADVAITGPGGVFLLDGLPPAPVRLRVVPPDGGPWRPTVSGPHSPGGREATNVGSLVLAPGHALRGTVDGAPRDAVARVEDATGAVREAPLADGVFVVDGLAAGDALVEILSAEDPGGARALVRLPSGWPLALTWRLAAPLIVRLRDAGRQPVTVVSLTFEPRAGADEDDPGHVPPPTRVLETGDVAGVYSVALEPGPWRVTARSGAQVATAAVDLPPGSGTVVTLELARGQTVRGFVASRFGAAPVEGAQITIEAFGDAALPPLGAVTDARGYFEVEGVPPGLVRVAVEADGHAPWRSPPVAVRSAESADLGQIDLLPGGAVTGIVADPSGAPARGAVVVVEHEDGTVQEGLTDLHGRFRIEHLPPGALTLRVGDVVQGARLPLGAAEVFVRIEPGTGVVLRGRVTTDGRPEPFARVTAWTVTGPDREAAVHADAQGAFALPALPAGEIGLEVLAAGAEVPYALRVPLPDAAEEWIDVELPAGGVAGEVLDATGRGVPGARLWLWRLDAEDRPVEVVARATAGAEGRFTVRRVEGGRYELEARRQGHGEGRSAPFDVRTGTLAFGALVELAREAVLETEIVDERGLPVAGAWLTATPYVDAPARVRLRSRAAADGRAVLRALAPGRYEVAVGGPGRGRVELGVLEVPEGLTHTGRVTLDPGGALRITVLHPGYVPAAGETVHVEDLLGRDPRADDGIVTGYGDGATAADGTLLIGNLAPGWYRVRLAADDPDGAYLVRVRPAEVTPVALWAPWPDAD